MLRPCSRFWLVEKCFDGFSVTSSVATVKVNMDALVRIRYHFYSNSLFRGNLNAAHQLIFFFFFFSQIADMTKRRISGKESPVLEKKKCFFILLTHSRIFKKLPQFYIYLLVWIFFIYMFAFSITFWQNLNSFITIIFFKCAETFCPPDGNSASSHAHLTHRRNVWRQLKLRCLTNSHYD